MDIREAKKRRRLTEWSEMVRACKNSGQTVRDWCSENGINPKAYYYRQKQVMNALPGFQGQRTSGAALSVASNTAGFVEVLPPVEEVHGSTITIQMHGAQIVIEEGVDVNLLEKVLSVVARTC